MLRFSNSPIDQLTLFLFVDKIFFGQLTFLLSEMGIANTYDYLADFTSTFKYLFT